MTDDFDVSLRRRLESLASAVPVAPSGAMTAVVRQPVRARPTSQLGLAGLLPVLAVVVIGAVVAGALKIGPGPGDSSAGATDAANGPIESTTRSGDFELTLRSAKARYAVDESIEIEASLVYHGSGSVQIAHGQGAGGTAVGFGVEEPVFGDLRLAPVVAESCERSTLEGGIPLEVPFAKAGAWSGDDPRADEYQAWFQDPVLRLPAGAWHVYAVAGFSIDTCSPDPIEMRVGLTIHVTGPAEETHRTSPNAEPSGIESVVDDGEFELALRSERSTYAEGEPINVTGTLAYIGTDDNRPVFQSNIAPIVFSVDPDPSDAVPLPMAVDPTACQPLALERPHEVHQGLAYTRSGPLTSGLPVGTWTIRAVTTLHFATCNAAPPKLSTTITIRVVPAPPLPVPSVPSAAPSPDRSPIDKASDDAFELTLQAESKVVPEDAPILLTTSYRYRGLENDVTIAHFLEIEYSIEQLDVEGNVLRSILYDMACTERTLTRDVPRDIAFEGWHLTYVKGRALPAQFDALLDDGILKLVEGRWRIRASLRNTVAPCGSTGESHELQASVDVEVLPATFQPVELLTADAPQQICPLAFGGGRLTADPVSGIGVEAKDGGSLPVRWPNGWTGWRSGDEVVLLSPEGMVIARTGDWVTWGGANATTDGIPYACTSIGVLEDR